MMKKRRLLALLLVLALAVSVFSATTYAQGEEPVSTAHAGPQSAGDGETLYLPAGGELYVSFELEGNDDGSLIPGWRNDLFKTTGFEIDDEPAFLDGDYTAYAHIMPGEKTVGESGTLYYNWYRSSDIFGENAPGWAGAEPVYSASVVIEVAEQPQTFAFLKDDDAQYFDGATIEVPADSEFLLCCDLTYYTDWWLPDRDLSDLNDKGFTYVERVQFEEAGFVYDRYSAAGLEPGTEAEVAFKWYLFDDYISGEISDKEGLYPATVKIKVVAAQQPAYLLGDADKSGGVTILDATAIQRYLASLPTEIDMVAADANGSGGVDILDATAIQRWLAGLKDGYPIGE